MACPHPHSALSWAWGLAFSSDPSSPLCPKQGVCVGVLLSTDVIQMRAQRQESRSLCWLGSRMLQILLLPPPCPPPPPLPHLIFGSRTAHQRCSGSPRGNSGGHPRMTQPMGHRSALITKAHFPGGVGECRKSVNADPSFSVDLMAPSPLGTGSSWRSL